MSKKLKAEDLEQDLLIEYSSRFVHFYNQNKAVVLGGGFGLVVAIAAIVGYFWYNSAQESQATELLGIAERSLAVGDFETALYGDDEEFTLGFVQIADNFSRTSSGNLAHYYAAVSEFELGNYDNALSHIERFNVPSGIIGVSPMTLQGNILIELERFDEAARVFERAANWDENSATTPANLFEAAQAHLEAGNRAEAERLVDRILTEYPNSQVANRAQRLKGALAAG
jgi:TolA-binding protein